MKEDFISFLWKYDYYLKSDLQTTDGERLVVMNHGEENTNAGPDFINALIRISDTTWAGNIEIHNKSSDWIKHKHHFDQSYDNVILHVVLTNDIQIKQKSGVNLPTLILKYDFSFRNRYLMLMKNNQWVACESYLPGIMKFQIRFWLAKIGIERLQEKSHSITSLLKRTNNNWEEVLLISLAGSLGMKVNSEPFLMLMNATPYLNIMHCKNNLFQLEALLFGQAGFLDSSLFGDEYFESLKVEYTFLRKKFRLTPIPHHLWKFLRLRPSNFPGIRIAQLAAIIFRTSSLFSTLIKENELNGLRQIFNVHASNYWETHYQFNKESRKKDKQLGINSTDLLIINTVIPIIFVYGIEKGSDVLKNKAIRFLEEIEPEDNAIIRNWSNLGFDIPNAFYSQAMIYLKKAYCDKKECLKCKIGNEIITSEKVFKGK